MFGEEEASIQSIAFGDHMVEVSYTEPREQNQRVIHVHSIAIDLALVSDEVNEIVDLCQEIVDKALLNVRNPDDTISRRSRRRSEEAAM